MAPRSPVLKNLLTVGGSLLVGGLAAQLALETRLIVSPYEVGGEGCVRLHTPRAPATAQEAAVPRPPQPEAHTGHTGLPPPTQHLLLMDSRGKPYYDGSRGRNHIMVP